VVVDGESEEPKWHAVLDGRAGPACDEIDTLTFSPDGSRFAYGARIGKKRVLFLDGERGPAYDGLSTKLAFGPDGWRFAYSATGRPAGSRRATTGPPCTWPARAGTSSASSTSRDRMEAVRAWALLLLCGAAAAAPFDRRKLDLVPGVWPWDKRALAAKIHPLREDETRVYALLLEEGIDPVVVQQLEATGPGPLLLERYAHGIARRAPDLTPAQASLLARVVPAVDAAQLALVGARDRLAQGLDEPAAKRLRAGCDRQVHEIEKRFWRVVLYALTTRQRAAIKPWLPPPYQMPPNVLGHVYQLPGLTGSQATRVRALTEEFQSENAADAAEAQRIRRRMQGADAAERARLEKRLEVIGDRGARLFKRVLETGMSIYTPEQLEAANALVPLLAPEERAQHPGTMIGQMALEPEQHVRLSALGARIEKRVREAQARLQERLKESGQGELGTDSPQMTTMQMMHGNAAAERLQAQEEAAREAVLEILEPEQVASWVVTPR